MADEVNQAIGSDLGLLSRLGGKWLLGGEGILMSSCTLKCITPSLGGGGETRIRMPVGGGGSAPWPLASQARMVPLCTAAVLASQADLKRGKRLGNSRQWRRSPETKISGGMPTSPVVLATGIPPYQPDRPGALQEAAERARKRGQITN